MNDVSTPPTAEEIAFLQRSTRGTPTGELVDRVLFHYGQAVGRAQSAESVAERLRQINANNLEGWAQSVAGLQRLIQSMIAPNTPNAK